ncbi:hypothetical protein NMG60_11009865 [Bertholletia excelsa]
MESQKSSFVLLLTLTILASSNANYHVGDDYETTASPRGLSGLLAQAAKVPENYSCDRFPRVCQLKGSIGRDCCQTKCVNVKTDRLNCGACGYKCKYPEICCAGKCVNASFDKRNCGGCNRRCKTGECMLGMCNYA